MYLKSGKFQPIQNKNAVNAHRCVFCTPFLVYTYISAWALLFILIGRFTRAKIQGMSKDKGSTLCFYVWMVGAATRKNYFIMCTCNTFEKKWLSVVRWIVLGLMFALLLVVIVMAANQWCGCCLCELMLSSRILRYALVGLFSLTTLWVAIYTLRIALKTSERNVSAGEMTAIVALRELFYQDGNLKIHAIITEEYNAKDMNSASTPNNVVDKSRPYDPKRFDSADEEECALNNYIGTLEVAYLMVEKGVITIEDFKNLFGYRLIALYDSSFYDDYISKDPKWHTILNRAKAALDAYMYKVNNM